MPGVPAHDLYAAATGRWSHARVGAVTLRADVSYVSAAWLEETNLDLATHYTFRGPKNLGTEFGGVVAGLGDLSGDGYPEVAIGSAGVRKLYVLDGLLLSPMDGGAEEVEDYALATITGSSSARRFSEIALKTP